MSVLTFRASRCCALCGSAIAAALGFAAGAAAQTQLPEVVVTAPKEKEKPKPKPVQVRAAPRPAPAPRRTGAAGARCTAGQSGHRDDEHPQPGTEHDLCADRDHSERPSVTTRSRRFRGATIKRSKRYSCRPPA